MRDALHISKFTQTQGRTLFGMRAITDGLTRTQDVTHWLLRPLNLGNMTKHDAELIANELYKVMRKNGMVDTKVIGVDEVAGILGCSVETVYRKLSDIPHTKFGKTLRFFESDVLKLLRR